MATQRTIDRMTEQAENRERRQAELLVEGEIGSGADQWLHWCKTRGIVPDTDPEAFSIFDLNDYLEHRMLDQGFREQLNNKLEE